MSKFARAPGVVEPHDEDQAGVEQLSALVKRRHGQRSRSEVTVRAGVNASLQSRPWLFQALGVGHLSR